MIPSIFIDSYTGNGAAKNIVVGFIPDYVKLVNVTDGDVMAEWFRTIQADGTAVETGAAAAPVAANGISAYGSSANTTGQGFTVGTTYSENAKVYGFIAMRSGPGAGNRAGP